MKKCDEALKEYEDKLHLGAQFRAAEKMILDLENEVREAGDIPEERRRQLLRSLKALQETVG